jgi:hypothetical protein
MSIYATSFKSSYDGEYFTQNLRETQNRHSVFNHFFSENRNVYEKTWKNMIEPDRPQIVI